MPSNTTLPTVSTGGVISASATNAAAVLNTCVGLFGKGTALSGTLESVAAPNWQLQGGTLSVTFTTGLSPNFNFPSVLPNGLLTVVATPVFVGTPTDITMNITGFGTTAFSLGAQQSDTPLNGTISVCWFAIGC